MGVSDADEDIADLPEPPIELRRAVFGGVRRDDVAALQAALAQAQQDLLLARAALEESAGWARRLPVALSELAKLAAGESDGEDPFERLAAAIQEVAGAHLLASVEFVHVYSETRTEYDERTEWHGPGRPRSTEVRLGQNVVRCVWADSLAGEDTVRLIAGLCRSVLFALLGVGNASTREMRGVVTQLGDGQALARHIALRERLGQPTSELHIEVAANGAEGYHSLYGGFSWDAAFADAGSTLEEVAHRCGGQAYQVGPLTFRLLVDEDCGNDARDELQERLGGGELDFDVGVL